MTEITEFVSSKFDVFAERPVQTSVQETISTSYNPIASIDQSDLEFLIPGDSETYVDLDIKLYVRGKIVKADGTDVDATDHTAFVNNFLHSLFSQFMITLNGVCITQASEF
jgi:hypothetical protein